MASINGINMWLIQGNSNKLKAELVNCFKMMGSLFSFCFGRCHQLPTVQAVFHALRVKQKNSAKHYYCGSKVPYLVWYVND